MLTTMDWEEAIATILSTIFVATTASWYRLNSTVPLNPVLIPSTWALFCMLIVSLTQYDYTSSMFNGIAVGSYVAMASESRLPKISNFWLKIGYLTKFPLYFKVALIGFYEYFYCNMIIIKISKICKNYDKY